MCPSFDRFFVGVVFIGCVGFGVGSPIDGPSKSNNGYEVTDYYWREFAGVIPSDAIPGGVERSGKKTYIGQMYKSEYGLLPATIYESSKFARASAGGKSFTADTFVKILCSRHQDRYRWIPTQNSEGHLLIGYHLLIGGTQQGYVLNIGRVNHEMEVVIGKVFANHTPYKGLSIPNKEKVATYQSYQILVFVPDNGDTKNLETVRSSDPTPN